jgi:hypothetical protein
MPFKGVDLSINSGDLIANDACVCQFVPRSDFSQLQFFKPMN